MSTNVQNITLGGIGGQGVVKASEICGWAAALAGFHVKKSEVHGMAQRGGSVESHVRFGEEVNSPLVAEGRADYLVCFHEDEHNRLKVFLKPDGVDLAGYLSKAEDVIENPRYLNTFLVGVLSAKISDIAEEHWLAAIAKVFAAKYLEENTRVFMEGRRISQE
ncbi:indolepyruvate oxidoreductase subunit beta [Anaerohalosphaera lusitana]|uniref:Indolepyruvate oxidoreductase subunit beta n=1 Tax=Anaerohalosphaera lusitana TaxID=1936003 RepID=A0A1U9NKM4_9BACT|nr:2-oxoacid:acceptor oxidoreductase family protein [Anaerohalosphaera lusitana]AQT68288.1 indolepyruvate oxidoreductase subunit beta [Anaerohalosphaera lusitana]